MSKKNTAKNKFLLFYMNHETMNNTKQLHGAFSPLDRPWTLNHLKGQCHEMDIFYESLNIIIITFFVYADGFQGLSKAFHFPIQLLTFLIYAQKED